MVLSVDDLLVCGRLQGRLRAHPLSKVPCRAPSRLLLTHAEFLLQFPCQTVRAVCGKAHQRDSCSRASPHWTFSIPRALRGLFERDHKLLGLLSQTAYAAILKTFQAVLDRTDVRPGCVVSLQTFGYVLSLIMS